MHIILEMVGILAASCALVVALLGLLRDLIERGPHGVPTFEEDSTLRRCPAESETRAAWNPPRFQAPTDPKREHST
jgi:hypothetical protein